MPHALPQAQHASYMDELRVEKTRETQKQVILRSFMRTGLQLNWLTGPSSTPQVLGCEWHLY